MLSVVFNKLKKLNRYAVSPEIIGTGATQYQHPTNWDRLRKAGIVFTLCNKTNL
jgi:hypothetical protein